MLPPTATMYIFILLAFILTSVILGNALNRSLYITMPYFVEEVPLIIEKTNTELIELIFYKYDLINLLNAPKMGAFTMFSCF